MRWLAPSVLALSLVLVGCKPAHDARIDAAVTRYKAADARGDLAERGAASIDLVNACRALQGRRPDSLNANDRKVCRILGVPID